MGIEVLCQSDNGRGRPFYMRFVAASPMLVDIPTTVAASAKLIMAVRR
ncbi:MAG: hypothetical protein Fues2KO_17360 [Fuerstiella sp.]